MRVFRLARAPFVNDLTGEGARRSGGRWNRKGVAVLYTAENRSLAVLELLVHLPIRLLPDDLMIRGLDLPLDPSMTQIRESRLSKDWRESPPPRETVELGSAWAIQARTLVLKVPSVVVPKEFNFVINPNHPDFAKIRARRAEPFRFDSRLLE